MRIKSINQSEGLFAQVKVGFSFLFLLGVTIFTACGTKGSTRLALKPTPLPTQPELSTSIATESEATVGTAATGAAASPVDEACSENLQLSIRMLNPSSSVVVGSVQNFQVTISGGSGSYLYGLKGTAPNIVLPNNGIVSDVFHSLSLSPISESITVSDSKCAKLIATASTSQAFNVVTAGVNAVSCYATAGASNAIRLIVDGNGNVHNSSLPNVPFAIQSPDSNSIELENYDVSAPGIYQNAVNTSGALSQYLALPIPANLKTTDSLQWQYTFHIRAQNNAAIKGTCSVVVHMAPVNTSCAVKEWVLNSPSSPTSNLTMTAGSTVQTSIAIVGDAPSYVTYSGGFFAHPQAFAVGNPTNYQANSTGTFTVNGQITYPNASPVACQSATVTVSQRSLSMFAHPYTYSELTISNATSIPQQIAVNIGAIGQEQINNFHVYQKFGICNWNGTSCYKWDFPTTDSDFICGEFGFTCNSSGLQKYRQPLSCNASYTSCTSGNSVTVPANTQIVYSFGSIVDMNASNFGFRAKYSGVGGAGANISISVISGGARLNAKLEQFDDYSNAGVTVNGKEF